jgi:hypothetical protein
MSTHLSLRSSRSNRLALVMATVAVVGACKKNDGEAAPGGYVQGQVGAGAAAGAGPTALSGQGGAPATALAGAGGAPAAATTGVPGTPGVPAPPTGPTAQRLDATAAAAVQPILTALQKDNVQAGAKPVGEAVVGNFGQNQSLEFPVQLQPNKCYTVVAAGLPPITEVNVQLQLTTVLPGMAPVLAVDSDRGVTAVIGKKASCYKWTVGVIPAPGKVVVQVPGAGGLVAVQVYEK